MLTDGISDKELTEKLDSMDKKETGAIDWQPITRPSQDGKN